LKEEKLPTQDMKPPSEISKHSKKAVIKSKKEKTIEVSKDKASDSEFEEEEDEEWEEEESEDEPEPFVPSYKPFDPRIDKMFDIGSESSDAFKKSLDHFNPDNDISRSILSGDFGQVYAIPGQQSMSGEDLEDFEELRANIMEEELAARGYINVNKKLPPKIPLSKIVRKEKQDVPSIKNFTEYSKKSGSSDTNKRATFSSEKRLTNEQEGEDKSSDDFANVFTEEQKVAMKQIMHEKDEEEEYKDVGMYKTGQPPKYIK
jgi:hypothetical protein